MIKAQQGMGPGPARYGIPEGRIAGLRYGVLAGALGLALMYTPSPGYYDHRLINALWGVGHSGLFFLITLLALRWALPRFRSPGHGWLGVLPAVLVLASVSEGLQVLVPDRTASWQDWQDNLKGIALAVVLGAAFLQPLSAAWRTLLVSLGSFLAMVLVFPLWLTLADSVHGRSQFPVLLDFSQPSERWRVAENGPRVWRDSAEAANGRVLDTAIGPGHEGLALQNLAPDWRGYRTLAIRLAVEQPVTVTVRIHDAEHERNQQPYRDRFNRQFDLEPGWQTLRIPLAEIESAPSARAMDLSRMRQIGVFNRYLRESHVVVLDRVRLEP